MIKIYLDTNILEDRAEEKYAIIYEKIFPNSFYNLINFVKENDFDEKIVVVIPQLVIDEIIPHFINSYKSCRESINNIVAKTRNILRGHFVADNTFSDKNESELIERIQLKIEDIINSSNGLIIKEGIPTEIKMIYTRAINKQLPFTVAHKNKKEYTDAGFKDVVLLETLLLNNTEDTLYLLTDDNGFLNLEEKLKFIVIKSIDEMIQELQVNLGKSLNTTVADIEEIFQESYMKEKVYHEVGLQVDVRDLYKVKDVKMEDDIAIIHIGLINNEVNYSLNIQFDYTAKEIINIKYLIGND